MSPMLTRTPGQFEINASSYCTFKVRHSATYLRDLESKVELANHICHLNKNGKIGGRLDWTIRWQSTHHVCSVIVIEVKVIV